MITPLDGSQIKVTDDDMGVKICMPRKRNVLTYFVPVFMICWLGGWFVGEVHAINQVIEGKGGAFLIFWLCGWTVGGIFAGAVLWRFFFGNNHETLILKREAMEFDSGNANPFDPSIMKRMQNGHNWMKRIKTEFDKSHIQTIKISTDLGYQRITIDKGVDRIEIGNNMTEIEREWLCGVIKNYYGIA